MSSSVHQYRKWSARGIVRVVGMSLVMALSLPAGLRAASPSQQHPAPANKIAVANAQAGSVAGDSITRVEPTGFDAVKEKAVNAFHYIQEQMGQYRPGGKTNPVSQEVLKVVFYFMATFVTCIFAMLILIVVSRVRRDKAVAKRAALREKYEPILMEVLYSGEQEPIQHHQFKPAEELKEENETELNAIMAVEASEDKQAKIKLAACFDAKEMESRFHRDVLIEQILELHKNLSGVTAKVLRDLYLALEFNQDAIRRLSISDWSIKAKAVRELSQMEIAEAEAPITELLNDSNDVLVLEVQIALLKLNREHPFSFLDNTEVEITEWQQLSLLAMISHSPAFRIPDFGRWLSSDNDSVVIFSTKMINYYNQLEAADRLIETLNHPNEKVRIGVIRCLGELEEAEAENALIELYQSETEEIQAEILVALGKIGTERAIAFLDMALKGSNFGLALSAAKGLKLAGQTGVETLHHAEVGDVEIERIVKHVMDERI